MASLLSLPFLLVCGVWLSALSYHILLIFFILDGASIYIKSFLSIFIIQPNLYFSMTLTVSCFGRSLIFTVSLSQTFYNWIIYIEIILNCVYIFQVILRIGKIPTVKCCFGSDVYQIPVLILVKTEDLRENVCFCAYL